MDKKSFNLSNTKAVLFDFDGTLLDSIDVIADSWRYTVKHFTGRGITDEEIYLTMGEMLIDSMRWLMPEIDPEEALEFYRKYQREIFLDEIKLFDGTEEVLWALKEKGYKNAIVTSRLEGSTNKAINKFGLEDLFDAVLTANDTKIFKPNPEPIYMVLNMLDCKPDEAIFIGDTVHDIDAGKAAGVYTVLVDWALQLPPGEKRDNATQADIVIKKLTDILTLLDLK